MIPAAFFWLAAPITLLFSTLSSLGFATEPDQDEPLVSAPQPPQERPRLFLRVGDQRSIRVPEGITRFSLGSTIVRGTLTPGSSREAAAALLIKAVSPGEVDLWIWRKDGQTEIRPLLIEKASADPQRAADESRLTEALSTLQEVEVTRSDTTTVLQGEIHSARELQRIEALKTAFGSKIHDQSRIASALLADCASRLERWLEIWKTQHPEGPSLQLERLPGGLHLSGNVEDPRLREAILREATPLAPKTRFSLQGLPDSYPTVRFRVYLLELKRTSARALGLQWPGRIEAAARYSARLSPSDGGWTAQRSLSGETALEMALNTLEAHGEARVLSRPELVVRTPGEAELFAGGEIAIRTRSQFQSQVTWKNFGLTLKLQAQHASETRVRLELLTEISRLDPTLTLDEIPGVQANRLKTQVDADFDRPLFLSGLFREDRRAVRRGLPFLKDLPVLGPLFGSDDFQQEKSELVAILLPQRQVPTADVTSLDSQMRPPKPTPYVRPTSSTLRRNLYP